MNGRFNVTQRAARTGVAVVGAVLLMGGATWHSWAAGSADGGAQAVHAAAAAPPITNAVAGSRDSYADIVDVVSPAVVTIQVEGRARMSSTQFQFPDDDLFGQFFGNRVPRQMPRPRQNALGSGVVVTTDGYILTNNHVVDGADSISVELTDGRTLSAKVIGTDQPSDLALIKVNGSGFKPIKFGDSNAARVGDVVLAVGNPFKLGQTVTMGIISAKGRSTGVPDGSYEDFLQTDAPINHGNSGGALVNTKGELVGINSQIVSDGGEGNIGIGFAIPANMARRVMDDLRTTGKVTRGQLGVGVQAISQDLATNLGLADTNGVIVTSVTPGSAAERAGLKRGDVIRSLNGQQVHDVNALRNRVAEAGPAAAAELVIMRDGVEKHLSAKLDQADGRRAARDGGPVERDSERGGSDAAALGITVVPLTPELASRLGAAKNAEGLVVQEVDPDGRASAAGIRAGDVIQEVNRQPVKSIDELRAAVRRTTDKPALLLINRQGADIFVTVRPANG
jgi:serine protease Do